MKHLPLYSALLIFHLSTQLYTEAAEAAEEMMNFLPLYAALLIFFFSTQLYTEAAEAAEEMMKSKLASKYYDKATEMEGGESMGRKVLGFRV